MSASDVRQADLYRLAELADELGAERLGSTTKIIADRVTGGQFYIACIGQFKRGKSTLLNALIGQAILPGGVLPVTSVPTILRFGEIPAARLLLQDSRQTNISIHEIEQYVSEENNPENMKGIAAVEIFVPSRLLATGMCLVDTPGLGSVFAANAKTTREFIPHMDAVLMVFGADPPISGEELSLLETIGRDIHEMVFVLNKADRMSPSDLSTASAFARQVIERRLHRTVNEVFKVSALERLDGRGPERDWPKLQLTLQRLASNWGECLAEEAAERTARRTSGQLLMRIEENRCALRRPLQDTETRIMELRGTVARAVEAMRDLGVLLAAERTRISHSVAERRRIFLDQTCGAACLELRGRLSLLPRSRNGVLLRREAMGMAQEIGRARLLPWLESEELHAEKLFREAMQRFIELGNNFLRRMDNLGVASMADCLQEIDSDRDLQSKSRFRFHMIERIAAPASPFVFVTDILRGLVGMRGGVGRDAEEFLKQLLEVNSSRVQSDIEERLREGRKLLETEISTILHDVETMTEQALARARAAQTSGVAAVQAQLDRLEEIEREIHRIGQSRDDLASHLKIPHRPSDER